MNIRYLALLLLTLVSMSSFAEDEVWIDVRSSLEHRFDRIEGDMRFSHKDIVAEVLKVHPDKDTPIALYCLSGGRAEYARAALQKAGYSNVRNVGGISDAREERGLSD